MYIVIIFNTSDQFSDWIIHTQISNTCGKKNDLDVIFLNQIIFSINYGH